MKTIVACSQCGAKFRAITDNVPDYGRASLCPLCGQSITLWKSDEHYLEKFSPEIATFLLFRKQAGPVSDTKAAMEFLLRLEEWLLGCDMTLATASGHEIQRFLTSRMQGLAPQTSKMARHTLHQFYDLLTRKELIPHNPLLSEPYPLPEPNTPPSSPHPATPPTRGRPVKRLIPLTLLSLLLAMVLGVGTYYLADRLSGPQHALSEPEVAPPPPGGSPGKPATNKESPPVQQESVQTVEKRRLEAESDRWAAEVVKRAELIRAADREILALRKAQADEQAEAEAKQQAAAPRVKAAPKIHCVSGECRNGTGTYRFDNGEEYTGEWRAGQRHGTGTYTFLNGEKYRGEWRNDRMEGKGVFTYQDGSRYEGGWQNNQRHGEGVLVQVNGDRYIGSWRNDKKFGPGTRHLLFADYLAKQQQTLNLESQRTATEQQQAQQEKQNRLSIEQALAQGRTGCIQGDCENGKGVYIYSSGDFYSGDWSNGDKHGQGIYVFKSGDRYSGTWHLNQKHGQGSYIFKSGQRYDGGWWLNKKHGQGTITFTNGIRQRGQWDNGEQLRNEPPKGS
ncbi:MAG: hypothetical protein HQM02_08190 [Magnetococcales bacterium]|nr:hypothetical protein [Magnetococcales bacterium]